MCILQYRNVQAIYKKKITQTSSAMTLVLAHYLFMIQTGKIRAKKKHFKISI